MPYRCPICGGGFNAVEQPRGVGGGSYCPNCHGRIRIAFPYARYVAVISFLTAAGSVALLHVRSVVGFLTLTVLIWIPLSLFLNVASTRFKPASFRTWKASEPRRRKHRTFFEWLYDRNAPQDLFKKESNSTPETRKGISL